MPLNQKMKFVQNGNDEFTTYCFISRNSNPAVRRLVFDAGEDVENLMTCVKLTLPLKFK
jgi:hypothetical protein